MRENLQKKEVKVRQKNNFIGYGVGYLSPINTGVWRYHG